MKNVSAAAKKLHFMKVNLYSVNTQQNKTFLIRPCMTTFSILYHLLSLQVD